MTDTVCSKQGRHRVHSDHVLRPFTSHGIITTQIRCSMILIMYGGPPPALVSSRHALEP